MIYIAVNYSIVVVVLCTSRGLAAFTRRADHWHLHNRGSHFILMVVLVGGQSLFHSSLKMSVAAQLVRGLFDNLLNCLLEQMVQFLNVLITLNDVLDVRLGDTTCDLAVLLSSLSQLLSLYWVVGCSDVSRRFLSEDILDAEDFVKELELVFGGTSILVRDAHPIVLQITKQTTED